MPSNTFCIKKCKEPDDLFSLDTGRKLNVQKLFWRHPSHLLNEHHMYFHFNFFCGKYMIRCVSHFQTQCLLYILFMRCKLYAAAFNSLYFTIICYYFYYDIVHMYVSILLKISCMYLIEHSSSWAAISCSTSVMLRFREREPRKHFKQDFNNALHSFDLIALI